jgi:hypothetical protein
LVDLYFDAFFTRTGFHRRIESEGMLRSKTPCRSKSHGHADMAARKAQSLVKSLRIDAGVMRQQFD